MALIHIIKAAMLLTYKNNTYKDTNKSTKSAMTCTRRV